MKAVELKTTNVANRVARFRELVPYKQSIMDGTGIPAEAVEIVSAKSVYPIMSPEGWEGRSAVAPVKGMNGLTVTIAECPPGNHPGLHSHSHTVENFFCLNGKFRVSWGEDGENSVELDPMDFVSVPAGVYRDFHNISDETARLLVMMGQEILEKFGEETLVAMDKVGFRFADRLQAAE
jgi:uncharacterized RmlC-like cupin family protein